MKKEIVAIYTKIHPKTTVELFDQQQLVESEILSLHEKLKVKEKPISLPKGFKVHRYPIF